MTDTDMRAVVDAVRRGLDIEDLGAVVRIQITLETAFDQHPAQIWSLLTSTEALATWAGPVHGDLHPGGRFRTAKGASGSIVEASAPHRLLLTWKNHGSEDPLLLRIDPEDDGSSRLRVQHTVLMPSDVFREYGAGHAALFWDGALLALAARTQGWQRVGIEQVPEPTPQWWASSDGAVFVRSCSIRWAAQALAAGVEHELAQHGEIAAATEYLRTRVPTAAPSAS